MFKLFPLKPFLKLYRLLPEDDQRLVVKFCEFIFQCRKTEYSIDDVSQLKQTIFDMKNLWIKAFPPDEQVEQGLKYSYKAPNFDSGLRCTLNCKIVDFLFLVDIFPVALEFLGPIYLFSSEQWDSLHRRTRLCKLAANNTDTAKFIMSTVCVQTNCN